jgi:hypothetical protein
VAGRRYDEYDHERFERPRRHTRPRTKERPTYEDATTATVVTVDRGRFTLLVDDEEGSRTVTAMKSRPLGRKGVVVGDLNDLNELFRGQEVYFVDSDSFQFGGYGCEVGTEDFLCPTLYDRALGGDSFSPETDWYSYAVLLYRSLLLVHPYGGVFPGLPNVTDRAKKKLTILDPTVKYPRLGASPEILTDELLEQFRLVFERGSYSKFPLALVEDYLDLLVPCSKCGEFFPATRGYCPRCSALTVLPVATLAGRYIQSLLFETNGPIVFSKVLANAIFAVAFEEGQTVLYKWQAGKTERFPLFPKSHDLTFDIAMGKLVVGKKGQAKLLLVDPETGHLEKTETSLFSGWPSMAGTENHLYRLAGGLLLCSELFGTDLLDDVIGTVLPEQTWVGAHTDGQERVMTVSRIFERWLYQILFDGKCVDGEVSELEEGEKLVQLKVKFGGTNIVLIRQTKKNGRNYLRVDLLGKRGYKLKHYRRTWNEAKHGQIMQAAFSGETLVYYSEDSLVAENLITGKITKFGGSENLLLGTETLYPWRGKILVVGENKATLIEKGG